VFNKIEQNIQNNFNLNDKSKNFTWLNELKTYNQKFLIDFKNLTNKYLSLQEDEKDQRTKWHSRLDQIMAAHDEELISNQRAYDALKANINSLNQKICNLEQEKYNIARTKDQTIEILNKELNRGVNISYLKKVLTTFLMSKEENVKYTFVYYRYKIIY
jgi:hypothetical protein